MTHAPRTQGGQRFDKVAQEYSEDKAKGENQNIFLVIPAKSDELKAGGSLGWMTRGSMVVSGPLVIDDGWFRTLRPSGSLPRRSVRSTAFDR